MTTATAVKPPAQRAEVPNDLRRSGCRSRPIAPSRRSRGSSRAPRTCITSLRKGARSSTPPRLCGAATPATTGPDRSRDPEAGGRARFLSDLSVRPSAGVSAGIPHRRVAPGDLDHVFSAILAPRPATPRSRSRSPITMCAARVRARASSVASAAITASASAAFRSAAWSTTASTSARCSPVSTICPRPTTATPGLHQGRAGMGRHLADALESIVALHDASTIAAVIVEPMAGSTGVLRRQRAISSGCARSATNTAFFSSSTR